MMNLPQEMQVTVLQHTPNLFVTLNLISTCKQICSIVFKDDTNKNKFEQLFDFITPIIRQNANFLNSFNNNLYEKACIYFSQQENNPIPQEQHAIYTHFQRLQSTNNPFHTAIENNVLNDINLLLTYSNIDPNSAIRTWDTTLHHAIFKENIDAIKILLMHPNIDPNRAVKTWGTPLHYAIFQENIDAIKILLTHPNIDPNRAVEIRNTPLHYAIFKKNIDAIKILLTHPNIDLHITDDVGRIPLHDAIDKNNIAAIKILLNKKPSFVNQSILKKIYLFLTYKNTFLSLKLHAIFASLCISTIVCSLFCFEHLVVWWCVARSIISILE
jgi:ankyrin repeat protein